MKAYKGFDKDLKCRNFQYEVGKAYEEKDAQICKTGFHACENPLEVFRYYPPCNGHRYCEVEQSGTLSKSGDSFKVASTKIKVGAELGLQGLIQAGISFILNKINQKDDAVANIGFRSAVIDTIVQTAAVNMDCQSAAINSGDQSAAVNTGSQSVAENTGELSTATNTGSQSVAVNSGSYSAVVNTGESSAAMNTGDLSTATNTGIYSAAVNTGYQSVAVNTGSWSAAMSIGIHSVATNTGKLSIAKNTGRQSAAINVGDGSAAEVTNRGSVAIATGRYSKAKASLGSAIVLVERGDWNGHVYPLNNIKAVIVDGKVIKADTWYTLRNGEFVECD